MLSGELTRFKRIVSKRLDRKSKQDHNTQPNGAQSDEADIGEGQVLIRLGGFKALEQSVAVTREVADFCRVVELVKKDNAAAAAAGGGVGARTGGEEGVDGKGGCRASARAGLFEPAFLLILHSLEVRFVS